MGALNVRIGNRQSIPAECMEDRYNVNVHWNSKDFIVYNNDKTFLETSDNCSQFYR